MQNGFLHHSRLEVYRAPQGALTVLSRVRLRLRAEGDIKISAAVLRLWIDGSEAAIPMQAIQLDACVYFEAYAQMPETPGLVWYYFILEQPDGRVLNYGGKSGWGGFYVHEPPGYQITVYSKDFETPRWFREGIIYQIFPDRFKKSGTSNDGIEYHQSLGRRVRVHEDWIELPEYMPVQGETDYKPDDFFCGNLKGILESLAYFKRFGVTCLYLNPVFESASNHRYDTADYLKVDPILGSNASLKALCTKAKEFGIRVILDGVFSHTGADSRYFNKYGRYKEQGAFESPASPYRSWFYFSENFEHGYRSWWGFPELPEVDEHAQSYIEFVMEGENSLINFWAEHGIAGWRLDVADELPDAFICGLRTHLKALNRDNVLLGEVWEDATTKVAYGKLREYALGNALDSVMNYPLRTAIADFLLMKSDAAELNESLQKQRERYPKPFYYAAMNMLSTHDTVRMLSVLSGAPDRDALTRIEQADVILSSEALERGKQLFVLAAALQMTLPGVPSIYYGDEAGLTGMADPFNRRTYPWGREDTSLQNIYSRLAGARNISAALSRGFCRMGALSEDVFAVLRYTSGCLDAFGCEAKEERALLLINRSSKHQALCFAPRLLNEGPDASVPVSLKGLWRDVLFEDTLFIEDDELTIEAAPLSARLLIYERME